MLTGSRAFVFVIYLLLGLSFIAETAVLAWEFKDAGWFTIATHDSHLFLFFPLLAPVALAAFYVPSCVFVDMYWRYVWFGRWRFAVGAIALVGLAWWVGTMLNSSTDRSIWEIAPQTLLKDRSEPAGCGGNGRPCERVALLEALNSVREVAQNRHALKDFVRTCSPDPLFDQQRVGPERKRFCFASTPLSVDPQRDPPRLTTDAECCAAQRRFMSTINSLQARPEQRSLTGKFHAVLLPCKIFFLLVLLAISILLAARHLSVAEHYAPYLWRIEVGVLVGVFVMIFFPLMSQGYLLTADALYGVQQIGGFKPMVPLLSFGFGAWGLLILLFFYRRRDHQVEMLGKMGGVLASAVAVVKYDLLISIVSRLIGAGASLLSIAALALIAVVAVVVLLLPWWQQIGHEAGVPSPDDDTPI